MRYDSGQFGSFVGLDNRKAVMDLVRRVGGNLSELLAARMRAHVLTGLAGRTDQLGAQAVRVGPCSSVEAYFLWAAIAGVLNQRPGAAEQAAVALEEAVRHPPLLGESPSRRPATSSTAKEESRA